MGFKVLIWAMGIICASITRETQSFIAKNIVLQNEMSEYCRRRVVSSIFLGRQVAESSAEVMHFSRLELPYSCSISVRTESGSNIILVILSKSEKSIASSCQGGHDQLLVYEMGETFGGYWGALPEYVFQQDTKKNHSTYYTLKTTQSKESLLDTTENWTTDYDMSNNTEDVVMRTSQDGNDNNYVVMEVPLVNVSGNLELGDTELAHSDEDELFDLIYNVTPKDGILYETSLMPLVQFSIWKPKGEKEGEAEPSYQLDYNVQGFTPDYRPPELLTTTTPNNRAPLDLTTLENLTDTWQLIGSYLKLVNANNLSTSPENNVDKAMDFIKKISNMKHNSSVYLQPNLLKYSDINSSLTRKTSFYTENVVNNYISENFLANRPISIYDLLQTQNSNSMNITSLMNNMSLNTLSITTERVLRNLTSRTATLKIEVRTNESTLNTNRNYSARKTTTAAILPSINSHQEISSAQSTPVLNSQSENFKDVITEKRRKSESGSLVDHESWENIVQVAPVMADLLNVTSTIIDVSTNIVSRKYIKQMSSSQVRQEKKTLAKEASLLVSGRYSLRTRATPPSHQYHAGPLGEVFFASFERPHVIVQRECLVKRLFIMIICKYSYARINRKKRYIKALSIDHHQPRQLTTKEDVPTPDQSKHRFDSQRLAELVELQDDEIQGRVALHYYKNYVGSTIFNMCDYHDAKARQVYLFNSSRIVLAINNFTMDRITIVMTESRVARASGCPPAHLECQVAGARVCVHHMNACDGVPNCGAYDIYDEDRLLCGSNVGLHYTVCLAACTFLVVLLTLLYSVHYWLKRCVPKVSQAFFVYTDKSENILYLDSIMRSPNDFDGGSRLAYHSSFFDDDNLSADSMKNNDRKILTIIRRFLRFLVCKKLKRHSIDDKSQQDPLCSVYSEAKRKFSSAAGELRKISPINTVNASVQTGNSLEMAPMNETKNSSCFDAPVEPCSSYDKKQTIYFKQSETELITLRRMRSISASFQSNSKIESIKKLDMKNIKEYPICIEEEVELRNTLYDRVGKQPVLGRAVFEEKKRNAIGPLDLPQQKRNALKHLRFEEGATTIEPLAFDLNDGRRGNTDRWPNMTLDDVEGDEEVARNSGRDFRRFWRGGKGKKNKKKTQLSLR